MSTGKYLKAKIINTKWSGEPAIQLNAGGYEAILIPGVGANLIKLKDTIHNLDLLRTPEDIETFKKRPQVYGIPLLFPPNRIEDGIFKVKDRVYNFPINEPIRNNHIHGFLYYQAWDIVRTDTPNDDCAEIELVFKADETREFFEYFPHDFEYRLVYNLSAQGLEQKVTIKNNSQTAMPIGIGFHTAFRVPFKPDADYKAYKVKASVDKVWELNERLFPTGKLLPLNSDQKKYRDEGFIPYNKKMDQLFSASPIDIDGMPFHGAIIEDTANKLQLVYEVGKSYSHWILWNDDGNSNFICMEPQSWATNAPNIKLEDKITGFALLEPGKVWEETSKIYLKEV